MKEKKSNLNQDDLYTYGIYIDIISNEKHYTVLQAKYKTSASFWLMVMFAAIGLIFSSREISLPLDKQFSAMVVCIVGIIGICFLWYEDLIVQERFLNINQLEATKLERKYQWLPQVHHQHLIITHKMMLRLKNIFYVGCNLILFIIFSFAIFLYMLKFGLILSIVSVILALVLFIYITRIMFIRAYKNELSVLEGSIDAKG